MYSVYWSCCCVSSAFGNHMPTTYDNMWWHHGQQLGRAILTRLVAALVLSHLDYSNAVLAGLPASSLAPLQRVIHAAARVIFNLKRCNCVTLALQEFHWLPVAERYQYRLRSLVHKTTLRHTPDYIADLLTLVVDIPGRSSLRESHHGNLSSGNCERQHHSNRNSRLVCSACLT